MELFRPSLASNSLFLDLVYSIHLLIGFVLELPCVFLSVKLSLIGSHLLIGHVLHILFFPLCQFLVLFFLYLFFQ